MRAKRSKQYRKLMHQYALHFDFREPYQVLLDAGFIQDAARYKMKLGAMLENTLHGSIKPMITQCCIRHLYNLPTSTPAEQAEKDSWIAAAKQAERRRCGHHELDKPLSTLECLESVVDAKGTGRNRHRYVVASQDEEVRRRMRGVAGVPLVYVNRSVMILEPMASATEEVRQQEEKGKMRAGLKGRGQSGGVKRKRENEDSEGEDGDGGTQDEPGVTKRKKPRGPKGPNPLSVMKPKKEKQRQKEKTLPASAESRASVRGDRTVNSPVLKEAHINESTDGPVASTKKRARKRKPKAETGDGGMNDTGQVAAEGS